MQYTNCILCEISNKNEKILDICCNRGRFLIELKKRGYKNLFGFDVMGPAIEKLKMHNAFDPDIFHIEHCLAQDYFKSKKEENFDWAMTYSATIELLHPQFDIFKELGRTVKKGMVLVLNEKGLPYPRFYRHLHKKNGFEIIRLIENENLTLFVSKKID